MSDGDARDPRVPLPLRVRPATLTLIEGYAAAERRTRSDMARILLGEGIAARQRREDEAARHG